jgi:hypothetical protein
MAIRAALIPQSELTHVCHSYCMVQAIWESLKVMNDDDGFLHFVGQNFIGQGFIPWIGSAPVSSQVANPDALRRRREEIYQSTFAPWFNAAGRLGPATLASWLGQINQYKALMLIDINARFDRVQTANARISGNLLAGKRAMAVVAEVGACAVVALGAGAALVGMFTVGACSLGYTTAAAASAAATQAAGTGIVGIVFDLLSVGVSSTRRIHEVGDTDVVAVVKDSAQVKVAGHAAELWAGIEHNAEILKEVAQRSNVINNALQYANKTFLANSKFRELIIETNIKADRVMAKSVFRGATAGVATVVCAGYEFNEHYNRLMEDWEDETKKKPGGKRE